MKTDEQRHAWEDVGRIVESGDPQLAKDFLNALAPGEPARVMDRLEPSLRAELVSLLPDDADAELMEALIDIQAADVIEQSPVESSAGEVLLGRDLPRGRALDSKVDSKWRWMGRLVYMFDGGTGMILVAQWNQSHILFRDFVSEDQARRLADDLTVVDVWGNKRTADD